MSISRGAHPLLVFVPDAGTGVRVREMPTRRSDRHTHLLGVDALAGTIVGVGLDDGPMTHAGDGNQSANMTFGGLAVTLR